MAGRGRGKDDYVIEKIITHEERKTILDNGSEYPYSEEDLEKSKCQYAFLVSWKDYEGEFTWQSFESFDGNLAVNYGRREGLELLGRLRGLKDSPGLRRRVEEIAEAQKQRHIAKEKKKTDAAKHEVIELDSESEGDVKKSVRENVKKKMNLDIGMEHNKEYENRRRRAITSSDESDEDYVSKEEKKKKNHSKERNKTDRGETSMKRSIKTKRDRVIPIYELSDDSLENSPIKKRKDSKEDDGIKIKKEDDKRSNRGSNDEEKRRNKNRSPKEGKKKQVKREDEHGSYESSESSDESGGEWEVDEVKMHVRLQEVLDLRYIEGIDKLKKMFHKTRIPIIFRVIFKSMKNGRMYKKAKWLTMEEMDNLPKLNQYADMSKLVLPKGYESLMKKKVTKDYDDIFKSDASETSDASDPDAIPMDP